MISADAPLTHERALADLRAILYAAQHARSTFRENGWEGDEVGKRVLEDLNPWLYGKRCIVVPLNALIQRCEANGGRVPAGDYINFLRIAHETMAIGVGLLMLSRRELPTLTPTEIFAALGDGLE